MESMPNIDTGVLDFEESGDNVSTLNPNGERINVSDVALAILVSVCQEGGEVEADKLKNHLSDMTGLKPSAIYNSLHGPMTKRGFLDIDLKSKPQKAQLNEPGIEAVSQNTNKIDSLKPKQRKTFSPRTFKILDYIIEESGKEAWLKQEGSEDAILSKLSEELNLTESSLPRLISRLIDDGYIEVDKLEKPRNTIVNIKVTEEGFNLYKALKEHPEAINMLGNSERDDPYNLDELSDMKLRITLGDIRDEIKIIQKEIGVQVINVEPIDSEMTRERLMREITYLHGEMKSLLSIVEDSNSVQRDLKEEIG